MSATTAYAVLPDTQAYPPPGPPDTGKPPGSPNAVLNSADVIVVHHRHGNRFAPDALFARFPGCLLLVFSGPRWCRIVARTGDEFTVAATPGLECEAAEAIHDWLTFGGPLSEPVLESPVQRVHHRRLTPRSARRAPR